VGAGTVGAGTVGAGTVGGGTVGGGSVDQVIDLADAAGGPSGVTSCGGEGSTQG